MLNINESFNYLLKKSPEDIATRLVPYFYYFEHMGKPIKNYSFAILYCSLAGPCKVEKIRENKALLDLLKKTNYGTTSPNLGYQLEDWGNEYVSDSESYNFAKLAQLAILRTDEIADMCDILIRKAIREDYSLEDMFPELTPYGRYNRRERTWPII